MNTADFAPAGIVTSAGISVTPVFRSSATLQRRGRRRIHCDRSLESSGPPARPRRGKSESRRLRLSDVSAVARSEVARRKYSSKAARKPSTLARSSAARLGAGLGHQDEGEAEAALRNGMVRRAAPCRGHDLVHVHVAAPAVEGHAALGRRRAKDAGVPVTKNISCSGSTSFSAAQAHQVLVERRITLPPCRWSGSAARRSRRGPGCGCLRAARRPN